MSKHGPVGRFEDIRAEVEKEFPSAPREFGDGVRTIAVKDIPADTPASRYKAGVRVRVPAPHHTEEEHGWLSAFWSR